MKFPAWFANFLLANTSNDSVLFPYFTLSLKVQFQTPAWNWPVCPAGKTCRSPFPPECKPPTCRPRTSAAWRQSIPRWGRKGGWPVVRRHGCCQTAARQSSVRCSGRSRCCAAQDACRRLFLPQGLCSRCLWGVFAPLFLWFCASQSLLACAYSLLFIIFRVVAVFRTRRPSVRWTLLQTDAYPRQILSSRPTPPLIAPANVGQSA